MSTLWTPGGEHPVERGAGRKQEDPPGRASAPAGAASQEGGAAGSRPGAGPQSEEELATQLNELREQLAGTPAAVVVANHGFGLFELAALHLSLQPPQLSEAQVAIDALGALLDGLAGRLGDHEAELNDALAQLRMAFVQIKGAQASSPPGDGQTQAT